MLRDDLRAVLVDYTEFIFTPKRVYPADIDIDNVVEMLIEAIEKNK